MLRKQNKDADTPFSFSSQQKGRAAAQNMHHWLRNTHRTHQNLLHSTFSKPWVCKTGFSGCYWTECHCSPHQAPASRQQMWHWHVCAKKGKKCLGTKSSPVAPISLKCKKTASPWSIPPPGVPARTCRLCTSLSLVQSKSLPSRLNCTCGFQDRQLHSGLARNFPAIYDDTISKGKTRKWNYNLYPRQWKTLLILSSFQNVLMIPTLNLMCYDIRKILTLAA